MKYKWKSNYAPWEIEYHDFFLQATDLGRLKFLIKFSILAPSSHNSQPWKFEVGDNYISIKPSYERSLRVSDASGRHLYIALGCALENLLIAADYYGYTFQVDYLPKNLKDTAVKVSLTHQKKEFPKEHLIMAICKRRSNRNKYLNKNLPLKFLDQVTHLSSQDCLVIAVSDQKNKENLTDILIASRIKAFSNKAFRNEMANYKRTNFTSSYFGMPGFTMGFNNLLSLFAPFFIRHFNVMKLIRKSEEELLKKYTSCLTFFCSKDDPRGWLQAGQILQRTLLMAEQAGIQTSMSAIPPNPQVLQEILGTTVRPQMLLRMGYTDLLPGHAPRFLAEQVTE